MKLSTIICILTSSLALCQNVSTAPDLITALEGDSDTQSFARLLKEHPDLLQNLNSRKNYTVFAPSNAAVAAFQQSISSNGSLSRRTHSLYRRRLPDYLAAIALLFTDRSNQGNLNFEPTNLITNLTDSDFVNLGPASTSASTTSVSSSISQSSLNSTISTSSSAISTSSISLSASSTLPTTTTEVTASSTASASESTVASTSSSQPSTSSEAEPEPTPEPEPAGCPAIPLKPKKKRSFAAYSAYHRRQLNETSLLVSSGYGNVAEASLSETVYNNGAIRKVDRFFTLFGDLASTLERTNGTAFASSLAQAGILDSLSKTPRITVFVPSDAVLSGKTLDASALQQYVLPNSLVTSPSLKAGTYSTGNGGSVTVNANADGSFSINGATITKPDVMIKNGVVHFIDTVYTDAFPGAGSRLTLPVALSVISVVISCMSLI